MLYISCKPHRLYSVQGLRDLESSKSSETLVLPRTTAIKGVMKMVGATRTVTMKQAPSVGLPPQGRIYYFAYGSNMEPSVLTDRRKV